MYNFTDFMIWYIVAMVLTLILIFACNKFMDGKIELKEALVPSCIPFLNIFSAMFFTLLLILLIENHYILRHIIPNCTFDKLSKIFIGEK